jgi:hypothetical protein
MSVSPCPIIHFPAQSWLSLALKPRVHPKYPSKGAYVEPENGRVLPTYPTKGAYVELRSGRVYAPVVWLHRLTSLIAVQEAGTYTRPRFSSTERFVWDMGCA